MNKKKLSVLSIVLIALVVTVGIALILQNSGVIKPAEFVVHAAGQADIYGDRIYGIEISNPSGSALYGLQYLSYTSGYTLSIPATNPYIISISVFINASLAGTAALAASNTQVIITIAGVTNNAGGALPSTATLDTIPLTGESGGGWGVLYWWPGLPSSEGGSTTWTPSAGTTYGTTIAYQVYY